MRRRSGREQRSAANGDTSPDGAAVSADRCGDDLALAPSAPGAAAAVVAAAAAASSSACASSAVAFLYSPVRSRTRGTTVVARVNAAPTRSKPVACATRRMLSTSCAWCAASAAGTRVALSGSFAPAPVLVLAHTRERPDVAYAAMAAVTTESPASTASSHAPSAPAAGAPPPEVSAPDRAPPAPVSAPPPAGPGPSSASPSNSSSSLPALPSASPSSSACERAWRPAPSPGATP